MKEQIKQGILQLLRTDSKCLVPELMNYLERNGLNVRGDRALMANENCIIWDGTTSDFNNAISELFNDNRIRTFIITPEQTAVVEHLEFGQIPDAQYTSKNVPHKTLHWLPMRLMLA